MNSLDHATFGDPLTATFWDGARAGKLLIQKCGDCNHHQFYPRPFCLACSSARVGWVEASGRGVVYSQTEVHMQASPDLTPPYVVAVVELDEGPKMMTNIVNGRCRIGDRVTLVWQARSGKPPIALFEPARERRLNVCRSERPWPCRRTSLPSPWRRHPIS